LAWAIWLREISMRRGSVSRSSSPKDSRRPSSSSSAKRMRSNVNTGLAMRPVWLAVARSAQLCASKVCTAGLLARASCTASSWLRALLSSSPLSLLRACCCWSLRLSSSLPCVKVPELLLVSCTAWSKLTEAQPARINVAAVTAPSRKKVVMVWPVPVCCGRRAGRRVWLQGVRCHPMAAALLWRRRASRLCGQPCRWPLSS